MDTPKGGPFGLVSHRLGALPLINHFLDRIGLDAALQRWLPAADRRFKLDPGDGDPAAGGQPAGRAGAVVRAGRVGRPVRAAPARSAGWGHRVAQRRPGRAGAGQLVRRGPGQPAHRADRRRGRRVRRSTPPRCTTTPPRCPCTASTPTRTAPRGGASRRAAVTFGHSKDHRPDLKQLVWILTVSADGSVPMAYRLADGNTSDDPTHIPTWDGLVKVLGRRDFLYVADSKLCSGTAMRHIDGQGGRFVTVLPRTRGEDKWFRDWIADQPATMDRSHPATGRADRRPRQGLVHVPGAAALGRGIPHRLGPFHRQGRPRRARPTLAHRGRRRRHRRTQHQARRAEDPAQDPRRRRASRRHGVDRHRRGPLAARSPSPKPSRRASGRRNAAGRTPAAYRDGSETDGVAPTSRTCSSTARSSCSASIATLRIVPPTRNIPNGIEHQMHLLGPVLFAGNAQARLFDRTSVLAGTIGLRKGRAGPARGWQRSR